MCVKTLVRVGVLGLLAAVIVACNNSTGPTRIGTPPSTNISGTWQGFIGEPMSGTAFRATWTASQSGSSVSGPITLSKPSANLSFGGTLNGTLSGNRLSLTYTIPRGNVPGFSSCSMSGSGSAEAGSSTIGGTLNITYSNCAGVVVDPAPSEPITFTK